MTIDFRPDAPSTPLHWPPTGKRPNQDRLILTIVAAYAAAFIILGLAMDGPREVVRGIAAILTSRDTLLTDYFGIAGIGGSLVHTGILTLLACGLYHHVRAPIGGASLACLFLLLGFGLFGKNLLNVWFIVAGVWMYARCRGEPFAKHINTAFFGAALAPVVTEILFSTVLPTAISLPLAVGAGLLISFILPPAAAQLSKAHMGFALYNVGFTAGLVGVLVVALLTSYDLVPEPVFIWTTGHNLQLGIFMGMIFLSLMMLGLAIDRRAPTRLNTVLRSSGQAPSDFIDLAGLGATLLNIGLTGLLAMAYILAIGGDINGPVIAGLLSVAGFGAFGKHPFNITPVMVGVVLGSLAKPWGIADPAIQLAALFSTNLAPVSGHFGWRWGTLAGYIHSSAALSVGSVHGGLNLYNNGFAAGIVASVLVPVIISMNEVQKRRRQP
ncbi:MAG: DUF1576 domain-containing protein [Prochlorococcaceae cyanobacterium]